MALSNWDLLAFDTEGNPSDGVFKVGNTEVQIYKNWLYVSNPKMWRKGESNFIKPVIAHVSNDAYVDVGNVEIITKCNKHQCAIFVFCKSGFGKVMQCMAGIGCYGFLDTAAIYADKMGLDSKLNWMESTIYGNPTINITRFTDTGDIENHEVPSEMGISFEDSWVGVDHETYRSFLEFLEGQSEPDYFKRIRAQTPVRFNQGDRYFADAVGKEVPKTPIEQSTSPMIGDMFLSLIRPERRGL